MDERVHNRPVEEFEDSHNQRNRIQDELAEMRQILDQIREAQGAAEEQNHSPQH
jgi:hypothetical protein